jgi:hypothetical protein
MVRTITTTLASFTDLLAMDVPSCPDFLKDRAVQRAAREFFQKTRSWRETYEGYGLGPGDKEIDANRLANKFSLQAVVLDINDMWLSSDGTPLIKTSKEALDKNVSGWTLEDGDEPTHYFMTPQKILRIYPMMATDADIVDLDVELILVPTLSMTVFPDYLFEDYAEVITAGAASILQMQPDAKWTSPDLAIANAGKFQGGIQGARLEQAKQIVDALNAENRVRFM